MSYRQIIPDNRGGERQINDYTTRGTHVIADIHAYWRSLTVDDVVDAAYDANMTILGVMEHPTSIGLILAESHLTVHMRDGYIAVDCFTCGDDKMPQKAIEALLERCGATVAYVCEWERGNSSECEIDAI